ncbi:MAG TPA: TssQ family T6SS-associated lipoprotein [Burkholderiales bacterium]
MSRRGFALVLALVLVAGCSSRPMLGISRAIGTSSNKDLAGGIRAYESADYEESERLLRRSLDEGLTFQRDEITAHKYLAFTYCVTNEERKCREQFRKVLELDPRFELDKSEAGHPIWGPVFRSTRASLNKK